MVLDIRFKNKLFLLLVIVFFCRASYSNVMTGEASSSVEKSTVVAEGSTTEAKAEGDNSITDFIMGHIQDAFEFHIADFNGKPITMPLPIILVPDNKIPVFFMSSEFHHDYDGKVVVSRGGYNFVNLGGEIYYSDTTGKIITNSDGKKLRPLNFSITKNVFTLMVGSIFMLLIFIPMARSYRNREYAPPKGIASFLEPLVLFVRDDIAIPNIGEKKYKRYMPYLLTIFFLIWLLNLMGLVPFFPFSGTLTNDILFTGFLATVTLVLILVSGNKHYWKHILASPGVPKLLLPIMIPVEIIGIFTKPFALMIRLFANITAGHIIILSLVSLIFIFKTVFISPVTILFSLFMYMLELLVAVLQAYVFTLLSALFIGQAVVEEEHD